jgi:YVTN family beta-propeller protein
MSGLQDLRVAAAAKRVLLAPGGWVPTDRRPVGRTDRAQFSCTTSGRRVVLLAGMLFALLAGSFAPTAGALPSNALVAGQGAENVTGALPINLVGHTTGPEIPFGVVGNPFGVAIAPDGRTAYITLAYPGEVIPVDVATNKAGPGIAVAGRPTEIAITPDGKTAYATTSEDESVTPIDLATDKIGPEIKVGKDPEGIAITHDGRTAYIANQQSESVTPIDLATNKAGAEIKVGAFPRAVAITPDDRTAYVTTGAGSVTPIDVATNKVGTGISAGNVQAIAITPDGKTAFVTITGPSVSSPGSVIPIDLATQKTGSKIAVADSPLGIAISPDGKTAFVTNYGSGSVTPIDAATYEPGPEITVDKYPIGIAITPPAAPAVVSEAPSAIGSSQATLNALVNPSGGFISECRFEYGTSPSYETTVACQPSPIAGESAIAVSAPIMRLSADTEYHVRITATNQRGTSSVLDRTFRTLPASGASATLTELSGEEVQLSVSVTNNCAECVWFAEATVYSASSECPRSWEDTTRSWLQNGPVQQGPGTVSETERLDRGGLHGPLVACVYLNSEAMSELIARIGPFDPQPPPTQPPPATPPSLIVNLPTTFAHPSKTKPLTRAQKLARAFRACNRKPRRKRTGCRARARKLYGPKKKAKRR